MNRFFTLLFAASCLTAVGQQSLTEGLFAWYDFEGNFDNIVAPEEPELATNVDFVLDENGQNQMGQFNGESSSIELQSANPQFCLSQDFTICCRVKINAGDNFQGIISRTRNAESEMGYFLRANDSELRIALNNDPPGQSCGATCNWGAYVPIDLTEEVTHIAVTRIADTLSVYVDGEIAQVDAISLSNGGSLLCSSTQQLFLGKSLNTWLDGVLDDVALWDRGLSSEEVILIFQMEDILEGCIDMQACNYDVDALVDDASCFYPDACGECGGDSTSGCTDSYACNFDAAADCDDGGCDYSCCPGPGCCDQGLTWNWELSLCQDLNPADINLDGCVQLNDLLDLLSAYGDCSAEESVWQCGDPLEYQGYDYETVQIGEQCWFAENLRTENYRNGEAIPTDLSDSEWAGTAEGAQAIYEDSPENLMLFGRLYNWYAVEDTRGLCPSNWDIPSDDEWKEMEISLGMSSSQANAVGWRGDQGEMMRSSATNNPPWNGSNSSGFSGVNGGRKTPEGSYYNDSNGVQGHGIGVWWSSTSATELTSWGRALGHNQMGVDRNNGTWSYSKKGGASVRCIKDAEQ